MSPTPLLLLAAKTLSAEGWYKDFIVIYRQGNMKYTYRKWYKRRPLSSAGMVAIVLAIALAVQLWLSLLP
ncbi:hypothetical protein BXP70_28540 [Hymenobacter crusticola]|uniref:Uncharacterized protein n=1 Tax=Hymenobacter crusticola TaxID=1770526 RepID=A0A243W6L3_9BACT|nr:hypothetical protein BXP70_28540 [Hymenobacter crusticola]